MPNYGLLKSVIYVGISVIGVLDGILHLHHGTQIITQLRFSPEIREGTPRKRPKFTYAGNKRSRPSYKPESSSLVDANLTRTN